MSAEPAYTVPADGNVFEALGFDSDEATRLLAEARAPQNSNSSYGKDE